MTDNDSRIAFIGGGNMASAIIGGLIRQGLPAAQIAVVEPFAEARARLAQQFGVRAEEHAGAGARLGRPGGVGREAADLQGGRGAGAPHVRQALHLSVAAGIRSDSIAQWLGTERIVRSMPNTPALVGKGMTALFARAAVGAADRQRVGAGDRHHGRAPVGRARSGTSMR